MASKSTVRIKFAIGRNVGQYDASQSKGATLITDAIANEVKDVAAARAKVRIRSLERILMQTVETEFKNGIEFAARSLIGTESRGISPIPVFTALGDASGVQLGSALSQTKAFKAPRPGVIRGQVNWRPLSLRQVLAQSGQTKGPAKRPGRFYQHTGALRKGLLSMARSMVKTTGVVRIRVIDKDQLKKVSAKDMRANSLPIANLRITVLPNVYPSHLPGLRSGDLSDFDPQLRFEKKLGLPDDMIKKLYGPVHDRSRHRPLLQPVMTFWALFKVPQRIALALNRTLIEGANKGTDVFAAPEIR